ncbi:DUF192 domain-containing protein [Natranaerobius thermophilus]|uniref:DUF192 domain-containing protein n=1 Tax=Natranaerobius thermophilus (strain ATCC BAA-1301 / DSM 18059 / JW/NM-WN-LF) TaxID=457570 RepID=B2A8J5_NATTJ|nr:DUF192 domain-containing protein [Natranaerobius thermophilus]ACB85879.1 protein of unknown function DUF192 [Natranaerobius thermophilus JW/NM-WN-LF]
MLIVKRTGQVLASEVIKADTFSKRFVGLMGKISMSSREALIIEPCNQVHTFFVFFPLDLLFIDSNNVIIKDLRNVPPFRITPKVAKASRVVELRGGSLDELDISSGDRLIIKR